jgi:ABC-2 type transport system ATP-binding protein
LLEEENIKIKAAIGFVPQDFNFNQFEIVSDIVLNQAGFYGVKRHIAELRLEKLLKMFNLWEKRFNVAMTLSGGMKRRLMLIRALIHKPNIIILDEPTAGVDVVSRMLIWNFLKKLNKNDKKTIILTTHYLEEEENVCNNVAILEKGKLLICTSVKKLLEKIKDKTMIVKGNNFNKFLYTKFKSRVKNNKILEVTIKRKDNLNKLLNCLIENNVEIYEIKQKHNKLEDLFLKIVG